MSNDPLIHLLIRVVHPQIILKIFCGDSYYCAMQVHFVEIRTILINNIFEMRGFNTSKFKTNSRILHYKVNNIEAYSENKKTQPIKSGQIIWSSSLLLIEIEANSCE